MNTTHTLLTAVTLLGFASLAHAQEPFTVTSEGENFAVHYSREYSGNILGGGFAEFEGQGRNSTIRYADPTVGQQAAGLPVDLGGGNGDVVYLPLPLRPSSLAAR